MTEPIRIPQEITMRDILDLCVTHPLLAACWKYARHENMSEREMLMRMVSVLVQSNDAQQNMLIDFALHSPYSVTGYKSTEPTP